MMDEIIKNNAYESSKKFDEWIRECLKHNGIDIPVDVTLEQLKEMDVLKSLELEQKDGNTYLKLNNKVIGGWSQTFDLDKLSATFTGKIY